MQKIMNNNKINLILMAGYPGVGKSTIARKLAKTLQFSLFDIDVILEEINNTSGIKNTERCGRIAYNTLKALVSCQIRLGISVIVDTPLTHQWLRDFMFNLASNHEATIHIIYCHCSDSTALERNNLRLETDPEKYIDRDTDNFYRIKKLFQPIDSIANISIDTEKTVAINIKYILEHIRSIQTA